MVVSIVLGIINVYGLTQSMNQDDISSEYLRFGDRDKLISSEQLSSGINKLRDEIDAEFAKRITKLIADGISHIHWEDYEPEKFHQQVPLWENGHCRRFRWHKRGNATRTNRSNYRLC